MATLPTVYERPQLQPSANVARFETSQSRAGEVVSRAGRELEEASNIVAQTNHRQDVMTAQSVANQLEAEALTLHQDPKQGFANVKGGGAVGPKFLEDWTGKFEIAKTKARDSLTNENQKRIFDQHAQASSLRYRSNLLQHQSRQTDAFNDQTENDTIDLARRSIFQSGDPQAVSVGFRKIDWAIDQKAQRQGWSPETTADVKAQYREKVYEDVSALMVERDPRSSLALLNARVAGQKSGHEAIDSLPPDKAINLRRRAFAYVNAADNEAKTEQEKNFNEAKRITESLTTFSLSGAMPSKEYEAEVMAFASKPGAEPFLPIVRGLLAQAQIGAAHGSQSLPRQKESIRALQGRLAGSSSPEQEAVLKGATTITNTQEAAYKENPWAAATQFARAEPTPEVKVTAETVPQLIAERLKKIEAIEVRSGMPVSPLQPSEAVALAESLKRLQPKEQGDILGAIGGQLSIERINALGDQLDKSDRAMNLALKAGYDRTNAGRSLAQFILAGRQALSDKTAKLDEEKSLDRKRSIAELIRGTLGPSGSQAEQEAIDAAWYVRAGLDVMGAPPGFDESKTNEHAVDLAIGKPLERGGVKTILPRGMNEDTFDEKLRTFTPEALKVLVPSGVVYIRNQPRNLEQLSSAIRSMGMRRDGKGRYVPISGSAPVTLDQAGTVPLALQMQ